MTIPLALRFDILTRDLFTCQFCGRHSPETELEVDHYKARTVGGSDDPQNLVTACRDCNRGKSGRTMPVRATWDTLVGKFFHTFCSAGKISKSGQILAEPRTNILVVRFNGSTVGTTMVRLDTIIDEGWVFYSTTQMLEGAEMYSGRAHTMHGSCSCELVIEQPTTRVWRMMNGEWTVLHADPKQDTNASATDANGV